jgi:hypothetical protein
MRLGRRNDPPNADLLVGTRAVVATGDLVAEIIPARKRFKVFEPLAFEARIYNRSANPIVLVRCNRSSSVGGSPQAEVHVAAPFDAFVNPERRPMAYCGNLFRGEVAMYDFIEVEPGEYLEPFAEDTWPLELSANVPTRPGLYTVTFRYSTLDPHVSTWSTNRSDAGFLELLARGPAIELVAKANFRVDF